MQALSSHLILRLRYYLIQKQDEYYRSIDRLCIRILEFLFVYDKLDCRSAGMKVHSKHSRLICEKLFLGKKLIISDFKNAQIKTKTFTKIISLKTKLEKTDL